MKTRVLHIRIDEETYDKLCYTAKGRGVNVSEYCRTVLGGKVQAVGRPVAKEKDFVEDIAVVPMEE